jgi:hypothetical protein
LKQHRTGSLVSCCQLLAKLLDSPQQPASFPLPVQSSTAACHGRPVCLSWALSAALVHLCACSSERVFFGVCVKRLFFYCSLCCSHACFCFYGNSTFH